MANKYREVICRFCGRKAHDPVQIEVDACQWFKNGDHLNDESGPTDKEGEVVRRFRRPDVNGCMVCTHCGRTAHDHGWIDTPSGGQTVCPGDWVVTMPTGEYRVYPDRDFRRLFAQV